MKMIKYDIDGEKSRVIAKITNDLSKDDQKKVCIILETLLEHYFLSPTISIKKYFKLIKKDFKLEEDIVFWFALMNMSILEYDISINIDDQRQMVTEKKRIIPISNQLITLVLDTLSQYYDKKS